jgi:hypothetical protein
MTRTPFHIIVLLALVLLTATPALAKSSQVSRVPVLAKGKAIPGEYIVKLKSSDDIGLLSEESVGRIVGGVVKARLQANLNLFVIKKDAEISEVYRELYDNDLVEYVEPNYIYQVDQSTGEPNT